MPSVSSRAGRAGEEAPIRPVESLYRKMCLLHSGNDTVRAPRRIDATEAELASDGEEHQQRGRDVIEPAPRARLSQQHLQLRPPYSREHALILPENRVRERALRRLQLQDLLL